MRDISTIIGKRIIIQVRFMISKLHGPSVIELGTGHVREA